MLVDGEGNVALRGRVRGEPVPALQEQQGAQQGQGSKACDGALRWLEELARRLREGVYEVS